MLISSKRITDVSYCELFVILLNSDDHRIYYRESVYNSKNWLTERIFKNLRKNLLQMYSELFLIMMNNYDFRIHFYVDKRSVFNSNNCLIEKTGDAQTFS